MARKDDPNTIVVVYNGVEYAKYSGSNYYTNRRDQHAPRLHQQVFIDNFGEIPRGYHVHHIDGDTENNSPNNLVAIPPEEHTKETAKQMWGSRAVCRVCELCGSRFETINDGKYCSRKCRKKRWNRDHKEYYKQYNNEYRLRIKRRLLNAKSK